jgi:hypothetical protein
VIGPAVELPAEILTHVFKFLPTDHLGACARVCRAWRATASWGGLWTHVTVAPKPSDAAAWGKVGAMGAGAALVRFPRAQSLRVVHAQTLHSTTQGTCWARHLCAGARLPFLVELDLTAAAGDGGSSCCPNKATPDVIGCLPSLRVLRVGRRVDRRSLGTLLLAAPRLAFLWANSRPEVFRDSFTLYIARAANLGMPFALRELCVSGDAFGTSADVGEALEPAFRRLVALRVFAGPEGSTHRWLSSEFLQSLARSSPNLQCLDVATAGLFSDNAIVAALDQLDKLRELRLRECDLGQSALQAIFSARTRALRRITLVGSNRQTPALSGWDERSALLARHLQAPGRGVVELEVVLSEASNRLLPESAEECPRIPRAHNWEGPVGARLQKLALSAVSVDLRSVGARAPSLRSITLIDSVLREAGAAEGALPLTNVVDLTLVNVAATPGWNAWAAGACSPGARRPWGRLATLHLRNTGVLRTDMRGWARAPLRALFVDGCTVACPEHWREAKRSRSRPNATVNSIDELSVGALRVLRVANQGRWENATAVLQALPTAAPNLEVLKLVACANVTNEAFMSAAPSRGAPWGARAVEAPDPSPLVDLAAICAGTDPDTRAASHIELCAASVGLSLVEATDLATPRKRPWSHLPPYPALRVVSLERCDKASNRTLLAIAWRSPRLARAMARGRGCIVAAALLQAAPPPRPSDAARSLGISEHAAKILQRHPDRLAELAESAQRAGGVSAAHTDSSSSETDSSSDDGDDGVGPQQGADADAPVGMGWDYAVDWTDAAHPE